MRHVAPLSPVRSVDCAYFPSPRGCTYPASILIQDFAASVSQCLCGKSRVLINLQPLCQFLCPLFRAPFLCFQELAASFCKTPGVGGRCNLSRPPVTSPLATFRTATTPVRLAVHSSSGQLAASPDLHTAMDKRIASADAAIAMPATTPAPMAPASACSCKIARSKK